MNRKVEREESFKASRLAGVLADFLLASLTARNAANHVFILKRMIAYVVILACC